MIKCCGSHKQNYDTDKKLFDAGPFIINNYPSHCVKMPPVVLETAVSSFDAATADDDADILDRELHFQFVEPVCTWSRYPCSLHFRDAHPSDDAIAVLDALSDMLGPLGTPEGYYGASGGPIYITYLGVPPPNNNDTGDDGFCSIDTMVQMIRPHAEFVPPATQWMTVVDPMHQWLFPKTTDDMLADEGRTGGTALFQQFYELVSSANSPIPATRIYQKGSPLAPRITKNFTFMKSAASATATAHLVFLLPRFDQIHDGDCNADCPKDDSVICEQTEGETHEAGDVNLAACYAMFQLQTTGELMALCNYDYRD
jgi:hypothetical protein